jgi:ADP-ribose pyrophosphatase
MPSFLDDLTPFYGTHAKNENGQTLESFLAEYDPKKYDNPCVTADIVVLKYRKSILPTMKGLQLLMVKRKNHPSIGYWALPGGFAEVNENLEDTAKRELQEETNLSGIPMEQLYTWGETWRDPRYRVITTSYLALVDESVSEIKAGDDAADAAWVNVTIKNIGNAIVEVDGIKKENSLYQLNLENMDKRIFLSAKVGVTKNKDQLLTEIKYQVTQSEKIAFDHSRVIVQALLHLERLLKK